MTLLHMPFISEAIYCIKEKKWYVAPAMNNPDVIEFFSESILIKYAIIHFVDSKRIDMNEIFGLPVNQDSIALFKSKIQILFDELIANRELHSFLLNTVYANLSVDAKRNLHNFLENNQKILQNANKKS